MNIEQSEGHTYKSPLHYVYVYSTSNTQLTAMFGRKGLACWPSPLKPRIPTFIPATWQQEEILA